ncbi:MAG: hypothetical protein ABSE55_05750 [Terracidiphilus sp.]|jgi:hypothetical protein
MAIEANAKLCIFSVIVRMSMRRFTRLTSAFSRRVENNAAANSQYFMYYELLPGTSNGLGNRAVEAGSSTHIWSMEELVNLMKGLQQTA